MGGMRSLVWIRFDCIDYAVTENATDFLPLP
jgi:hypothetical protein